MKLHHLAAATLLLGSSALALAATDNPYGDHASAHEAAWGGSMWNEMARSATAWQDAQPLQPVQASAISWDGDKAIVDKDAAVVAGEPDLDLAEKSIETSEDDIALALAAESADPVLADAAKTMVDDPAMAETAPVTMVAADLQTRPATQNYPACDPGPGDDSCIQLYEPGVRTALAGWTAPTGGLSDGSAVAMGGPLEEEGAFDTAAAAVDARGDAHGDSAAMHGDHRLDSAMGEQEQGAFAERAG